MRFYPHGAWSIENLEAIHQSLKHFHPEIKNVLIDGADLELLDTSGAMVLFQIIAQGNLQLKNFRPEHQRLITLVKKRFEPFVPHSPAKDLTPVQTIGRASWIIYTYIVELISFIGEALVNFWRTLRSPTLFRHKEFFVQLKLVCVDAVPIVALVTFLIGVVVAYLFSTQLERYGANIFIVDGVSLAMCRELSPIVVAIIVAGRSGSAFTAQIGTMKLNEEIDALRTLGLSPMLVLVQPRVFALMLALPLLVFVGDIVGIFGGALIADFYLDITSNTFIERLRAVLLKRHVIVGLLKAPVFAMFIALIGCRMGLSVENNARSVGIHTTSTVVQSIVSVILLNAAFAVIFVELGI